MYDYVLHERDEISPFAISEEKVWPIITIEKGCLRIKGRSSFRRQSWRIDGDSLGIARINKIVKLSCCGIVLKIDRPS